MKHATNKSSTVQLFLAMLVITPIEGEGVTTTNNTTVGTPKLTISISPIVGFKKKFNINHPFFVSEKRDNKEDSRSVAAERNADEASVCATITVLSCSSTKIFTSARIYKIFTTDRNEKRKKRYYKKYQSIIPTAMKMDTVERGFTRITMCFVTLVLVAAALFGMLMRKQLFKFFKLADIFNQVNVSRQSAAVAAILVRASAIKILLLLLTLVGGVRGYDLLPNGAWGGTPARTRDGLGDVVSAWIADGTQRTTVVDKYGPIEEWDVSAVTDMRYVFADRTGGGSVSGYFTGISRSTFNADISKWNVAGVTVTFRMFESATSFNIDISSWNVVSVADMGFMFDGATSFNHQLCGIAWVENAKKPDGSSRTSGHGSMFGSSSSGSIATTPCSCTPGRYLTSASPKSCEQCLPAKYQDEEGFTGTCKLCPSGRHTTTYSTTSADDCTSCGIGTFMTAIGPPIACVICPSGRFQPDLPTLVTDVSLCQACQGGRFNPDDADQAHLHESCISCESGEYAPAGSATCSECAAGKYSDEGPAQTLASVCKSCVGGKYSDAGVGQIAETTCKGCAGGKYSDDGPAQASASVCKSCTGGKYTAGSGTTVCTKQCSAGKFSNEVGLKSDDECQGRCSPGKYSSEEGLLSDDQCQGRCSPGKYSSGEGLSSDDQCEKCYAGKFSSEEGLSSEDQCRGNCSAGKYSIQVGLTSDSECTSCVVGKYSFDIRQSTDSCKTCPKGYEINGTNIIRCFVCGFSKYQDQDNIVGVRCKTCADNKYITDDRKNDVAHQAASDCIDCPNGKFAAAGQRVCDTCPAGWETNTDTSVLAAAICVECNPGQFSSNAVPTCSACPKGYLQSQAGTPYW